MRIVKYHLLGVLITLVIVSIVLASCSESPATSTVIPDQATVSVKEHDDHGHLIHFHVAYWIKCHHDTPSSGLIIRLADYR